MIPILEVAMGGHTRKIVAAFLLTLTLVVASLAPVGAYYGETEGYRTIDFSADGRGCHADITVFNTKAVQVYCDLRNASGGYVTAKSNYVEYSCWYAEGCNYSVDIGGWSDWYAVGVWTMKKDDYGGLHATINNVYSPAP